MKKIIALFIALILSAGTAFSHEDSTFQEAKDIIKSKIPCSELTDEQLEHLGDYYMEQMHPGEAHELMDKMMGGEGSESLKQMHITMAKSLYCDEDISGMSGMMGMMNMMGMMGGGMMNMAGSNMMGYGMMGNFGYGSGYLSLVSILYLILLIGLVILVYLWIFRLLKGAKIKGGKKWSKN